MSKLDIEQFNCRSDNFGVLVHDPDSGLTACIDAPDYAATVEALKRRGWTLSHIFITHHHTDHVEALEPLKSEFGARVIGPKKSAASIGNIDIPVVQGNVIEWAGRDVRVLDTPGHTLDHTTYWFCDDEVVFTADVLFSLGCGRVFEGDHAMMWDSLEKLAALPDATKVYCGHEYTLANARFALSVDPDNADLAERAKEVARLRQDDLPTLPTTIGVERKTNPFLRADNAALKKAVGMENASAAEVFAYLRTAKDKA